MKKYANKTCCIIDFGLFVELAVILARDFEKVYYYNPSWRNAFPTKRDTTIGLGLEGVEVITEFWNYKNKIDFFIFPDVYMGDYLEELRSQGKLCWGSGNLEWIELERWKFLQWLTDNKMPVPLTEESIGVDELEKDIKDSWFVKVEKFRGDTESFAGYDRKVEKEFFKTLRLQYGEMSNEQSFMRQKGVEGVEVGYDGWIVNGQFPRIGMWGYEVKGCCYVGKFSHYESMPAAIKYVNQKVSPLLKNMTGNISTEIRIPYDDPKKFYFIDPCFSEDTEILSNQGWKYFKNLNKTETVATLNVETKEIEYQSPTDYLVQSYTGNMINISNRVKTIEKLVTPNHGVWRTDRKKKKLFVERADSLSDKGFIPRSGKWTGCEPEKFILPEYHNEWKSGKGNHRVKHENEKRIEMEDWLKFFGYYLSGGSQHGKGWSLNISQINHKNKMLEDLKKLPFSVTVNDNGILIHSVQLSSYMQRFGLCNEKYVPDFIKELSPRLIRIFLEAYKFGDGSRHKNQNMYFTTSKTMADDLQELIFKAGTVANIHFKQTAGTSFKIRNKTYTRKYDSYIIAESEKCLDYWFETKQRKNLYIKEVYYSGLVYDVTVPNHTVYVRRNGKPFWSSNCMRLGNPPHQCQLTAIKNLPEMYYEGAQGKLINPDYDQDEKFVCMALMSSEFAVKNELMVSFPEKLRRFVRLKNLAYLHKNYYVVPPRGNENETVGAVVGVGRSMKESIENCKNNSKEVTAFRLEIDCDKLDKAQDYVNEGIKLGINF